MRHAMYGRWGAQCAAVLAVTRKLTHPRVPTHSLCEASAKVTNRGWDTNAILGHVDPHSVTESACTTHAVFSHEPLWMILPDFWGWMSLHRQKRLDERNSIAPSLAAQVDRECASQSHVEQP